jgi:hypothetical protein
MKALSGERPQSCIVMSASLNTHRVVQQYVNNSYLD